MTPATTSFVRAPRTAWAIVALLLLINLLNFIDRMIPAVVLEDIRKAYALSDLALGLLVSAFTVVFALSGLPLGRLADRWIRKYVLAGGAMLWSLFTLLSGVAPNFGSFLIARLGVGIGEASYAPAAVSLITDLFPKSQRGRAVGLFMLGLPLGVSLSFVTIAKIKALTGSWQAPFVVAGGVGLLVGAALLWIREPLRGGSDAAPVASASATSSLPDNQRAPAKTSASVFRHLLGIRSLLWLSLSGITVNMASYGTNTFFKALMERYYGVAPMNAGWIASAVLGLTGLLAMTAGAALADRLQQRRANGRLQLAAYAMLAAAPLVALA